MSYLRLCGSAVTRRARAAGRTARPHDRINDSRLNEVVGTGRFELPTCRLGGDRSIQSELRARNTYIVARMAHRGPRALSGEPVPSCPDLSLVFDRFLDGVIRQPVHLLVCHRCFPAPPPARWRRIISRIIPAYSSAVITI